MPQILPEDALNTMDPELPLLASDAAVEVDRILQGLPSDRTAAQELALRLRRSVQPANGTTEARHMMDPATMTVLIEALGYGAPGSAVTTVADLISHTTSVADNLTKSDRVRDRAELESVRVFCISLSRLSSAYRKSIEDLHPSHPFRT